MMVAPNKFRVFVALQQHFVLEIIFYLPYKLDFNIAVLSFVKSVSGNKLNITVYD